ncbi:ubiquinol-cytochrome c reductase iron-sulfur subunit [Haloarchaeobius sp. HRN-SO-5]|uniref:ubiquinol-cytochrome c reductase iron-sulfur subunit n=1 Tax=Haloarchaeobius sp. HRN-SO-5 TaxID=3446118 RepID=UPI003EB96CED
MDEDKYPATSDRRRFVEGVVGGSAMTAVVTAGGVAVESATTGVGEGGGSVTYRAVRNTAGPAPRGMPQIPIEIDEEGYLRGIWPESEERELEDGTTVTVAETEIGGVTYSTQWFQYCGCQTYQNVQPDSDHDDYFRYSRNSRYEWQNEAVDPDERVHVDHFDDYARWNNGIGEEGYGKPGKCTWRSQEVDSEETLPVQVIRSPLVERAAQEDEWLAASTADGFLAYLNKCTHFCCIPGFKNSTDAPRFGASNESYCGCHQSVYDPFDIVERSFTALPRPSE